MRSIPRLTLVSLLTGAVVCGFDSGSLGSPAAMLTCTGLTTLRLGLGVSDVAGIYAPDAAATAKMRRQGMTYAATAGGIIAITNTSVVN